MTLYRLDTNTSDFGNELMHSVLLFALFGPVFCAQLDSACSRNMHAIELNEFVLSDCK